MSSQPQPATRGSGGRTVKAWFNLLLTVMVVLICVGAVSAAVSLERTREATDELIEGLMPARAAAADLEASLLNQETGVRGYALSGDSSFLEPYTEGVQIEQRAMDELRGMIGDRSELGDDLIEIKQASTDWRSVFADPLLARTPGEGNPIDPVVYERGRLAFDQVRVLIGELDQHVEQARLDAMDRLADARHLRTIVFSVMFLVLLAATGILAVLIRKAVLNPLRRLGESSRKVVQGSFGQRIDAGNGPSDIRALAEDVEAMRQRIVAELEIVQDRQARLEAQTTKLDAQTVELRRSNAELEQFAYVTSHDLQEPLRKVASFCQLLEKRYGDELDERGRQYIDFAVDGAKRMQALINDLLDFSRVGRMSAGFEPLSLDRPFAKALSNLAAAVEDSGARIHAPERLPDVEGDPTLLTMLWQNLIGNAIKFAEPGTVPEVSISVERRPDVGWLVSVQDNGIGISGEFADKIFVIFQRLHARDEYSGTGIGLALCKKIVEYHGGRIWLDTDYTGGARFCFTLPEAADVDRGAEETIRTTEGALT
ncbi:HAMP domain-containing protein [Rhodococcus sp. OK519]|uniref:sensor histidine kinase n=1 Tax=Rhodococcus sp. OK519 TaxID=2135729 RepID=UPI000D33B515|nr:HAMP domain-containing protein [Rhodococcus sp. OK519]